MAILCRHIGLLLLQAPHTGSTSLGTLLRSELGGEMLVEERVRDARGRVLLRQKHQTLQQLLEAGLITPEQRRDLLVVVGARNPYDLVVTEYARNREAGRSPLRSGCCAASRGWASTSPRPTSSASFVVATSPGGCTDCSAAGRSCRSTGPPGPTTSSASRRCRRASTRRSAVSA
jgi:hypothetical protein